MPGRFDSTRPSHAIYGQKIDPNFAKILIKFFTSYSPWGYSQT